MVKSMCARFHAKAIIIFPGIVEWATMPLWFHIPIYRSA